MFTAWNCNENIKEDNQHGLLDLKQQAMVIQFFCFTAWPAVLNRAGHAD